MTQHLFLLPKTAVFAARVNEPAGVTYPLSSVEFDGVTTGAFGDIKVGMTVLFGSTAGNDDLGRNRIRAAADADTLFIGRSSQGIRDGELNISDNDYITVIDDRRVWAKIPDIDSNGDVVKDEAVYTDQTSDIPPKANIAGGWRAATIASGTSVATFQFIGTASYGNGGATIASYLWDVDDGTITVGTSASNTITATFPAGSRWVKLTVTDSNGKTHFMEVLVYARDPASDTTIAFECTEHTITAAGQQCAFHILEDIPASTYPDGMPVIFWEGEPASASDSSNVKLWGWHQTDANSVTAERTATLKDTTLYCVDTAGRLDTLPGFPQSVTRKATPATWLEMAGLNMDLYLDYLLRWHSNAFEIAYYTPTGTGSSYSMTVIASDGQSLWDQVHKMAGALVPDYELTCDRSGAIRAIVNPILQDTGDRTATSQVTITDADFTSAAWERRRPPRFHWNWAEALQSYTSGDPIPLFCVAPGFAPGQGESEANTTEQLAQSQDDLNACEGHRYAYTNAFHGQVALQLLKDDGIEPADMTWVTLTIDSSYHRRQLGFSAARGLPIEVNISYNYADTGMTKTVEVLWEEETSGTPATTYEQPEEDWDWKPPEPIEIPPPPTTVPGDGFGTVSVMYADNLIRTRDFSVSSPAWSVMKAAGGSEDFYDFILDPFDHQATVFLLGSDGVYRSTDYDLTSPSWTQVLTLAQMNTLTSVSGTLVRFYKITGTIKKQNFFAFGAWENNGASSKTWMFVTEDGGDTWAAKTVHTGIDTNTVFNGAIAISDSGLGPGGDPIIGIVCGHDGGKRFMLSTDGGDNWTQRAAAFSAGNGDFSDVHFPHNGNSDSSKILISAWSTGSLTYTYYISTDQGANWTGLTDADLGSADSSNAKFNRTPFQSWTNNYQELYAFAAGSAGSETGGFYRSSDFGSTWNKISDLPADAVGAGGFPYNSEQFYVLAGNYILVSIDDGATWIDKTGDWAGPYGGVINSGSVIVPVWGAE